MASRVYSESLSRRTSRTRDVGVRVLLGVAFVVPLILLTLAVRYGPLTGDFQIMVVLGEQLPRAAAVWSDRFGHLVDAAVWDPTVVVIAAVLWMRQRQREAVFLLLGLGAEGATALIRILLGPSRAPGAGLIAVLQTVSFPSGHVVRAVVTVGLAIALLVWPHRRWRLPAVVAGLAFVAALGAARVIAYRHYPTDVVGSYLLGGLWLNLLLGVYRSAAWQGRLPSGPARSRASAGGR